jgi:MYXO-CTERM domain-containing protein
LIRARVFALVAAVLCAPAAPALGAPLFQAIDLADTSSGTDLWRYIYTVDAQTLGSDPGLAIFFNASLYGALSNPSPDTDRDVFSTTDPHWDILLLDPDLSLPADGVFDAFFLPSGTPGATTFSVDFVWLGAGAPASQSFYTYSLDADGNVVVGQDGVTVASSSVPEPATWALVLPGLVAAWVRRARQRRLVQRP